MKLKDFLNCAGDETEIVVTDAKETDVFSGKAEDMRRNERYQRELNRNIKKWFIGMFFIEIYLK